MRSLSGPFFSDEIYTQYYQALNIQKLAILRLCFAISFCLYPHGDRRLSAMNIL